MTKILIAAALTVFAGSALAQEVPFWVQQGEVVYTGQTQATDAMFRGSASASVPSQFMLEGGNINWDQNYSGK